MTGIPFLKAQILSRSSKKWFDITPVAGTRKARKFLTGLLYYSWNGLESFRPSLFPNSRTSHPFPCMLLAYHCSPGLDIGTWRTGSAIRLHINAVFVRQFGK